jgi:hypothetical protein
MTWDGDRLRPGDRRQSYPFYPRAGTALTPFDVRPFSGTYAYDGYRDLGCCLFGRHVIPRQRVLRVRG